MPRLIAVTGATGNQGGSVSKLLLQYPDEYRVRAFTRDAQSSAARALADMGAEVVQADLTKPDTLPPALEGCWGVFGVTNFYDAVRATSLLSQDKMRCGTDWMAENQERSGQRGDPGQKSGPGGLRCRRAVFHLELAAQLGADFWWPVGLQDIRRFLIPFTYLLILLQGVR
jgi:hypothetical protein